MARARHAKQIDPKVQDSTVYQFVLGIDESEHLRGKQDAEDHEEHAEDKA